MANKQNHLIGIIDKPQNFYDCLMEIRDVNELLQTCNELKQKREIDYFDIAYKAVEDGCDIFLLSHVLEKIAFLSILDLRNITKLYELFFEKMRGDMASGGQYEITKSIASHHIDFSLYLLQELYKSDLEYATYHIAMILTTLHNEHQMNQYKQIKKYLEDTADINKTLSSIEAISKIDLTQEEVDEVFDLFKKISDSKEERFCAALVYSCNRMKNVYPVFKNIFLLLSDIDNKTVKFHISRILSFNEKGAVREDWYRKCLFALTDTTTEELGIVDSLSHVFMNILEATNDYRTIRDFFAEWVKESEITLDFPERTLEHFIYEFADKYPVEHSKFITEIFYSENEELHRIVRPFVTTGSKFSKEMIDEYTLQDFIYMCRKALGYLYEFDSLSTLIWSLSEKDNLTRDEQGLIADVFKNHIGDFYPKDTLDFFTALDSGALNKSQNAIVKYMVDKLGKDIETYENLPRFKELIPASRESREVTKANQLSIGDAIKKAQSESIIGFLGTPIHIKYGRGSFHYMNGEYTKPSYLQRVSTQITFPVTERIRPTDVAIQRYHFRKAKKGES